MGRNLAERHAQLIAGLRDLKKHSAAGGYAGVQPQGLSEAAAALVHVISFLRSDDAAGENLEEPLHRLAVALIDISEGRQPPMLTAERKGGRPPKGVAEDNVMGIAARALHALVESGRGVDEAAIRVASIVQARRVAGHKQVTATTVRGWRERLSAAASGFGTPDRVPEMALMRWNAPLPPEAGTTPAEHAAFLIWYLKTSPELRWS